MAYSWLGICGFAYSIFSVERNSKLFTENLPLRQFLHCLQEAMKTIPAVFNSDVQEADF